MEYLKTKFDADLAAADYDARTPLHIAVMQIFFLRFSRSCLLQEFLKDSDLRNQMVLEFFKNSATILIHLCLFHKRCSCPFGTIIWDDVTKIWDENLLLFTFFNWQTEKKPVLDQSEVCLPKYHNKFS